MTALEGKPARRLKATQRGVQSLPEALRTLADQLDVAKLDGREFVPTTARLVIRQGEFDGHPSTGIDLEFTVALSTVPGREEECIRASGGDLICTECGQPYWSSRLS